MRYFDIEQSINHNLSVEMNYTLRDLYSEIYELKNRNYQNPNFEAVYMRFEADIAALETKKEAIIQNLVKELGEYIAFTFVREDVPMNSICICTFQVGSMIEGACIEGGVVGKKMIFSSADIPDYIGLDYTCTDYRLPLETRQFAVDLYAENILSGEGDEATEFLWKIIRYYDHKTRQQLMAALTEVEKLGILHKMTTKTPVIFHYGEPNNDMWTVYYFENK